MKKSEVIRKIGKPAVVSLVISMVIFGICRYIDYCDMAYQNLGADFVMAFLFGVSYSSLLWAYDCYRRMKEQSDFVGWLKEFSFFFVHVAVVLCLLAAVYIGKEDSYVFIAIAAGCILFPCFYSAVYYLTVRLCNQYRVGLLIGMVLCTSEFMQINFVKGFGSDVSYDILHLFSGWGSFMHLNSYLWLLKIVVLIVLMYIAAVTITKKAGEDE